MLVPYSFFFHVPECSLGTAYSASLVPGRSCNSSGAWRNRSLGATAGWSQSGPPKMAERIRVKDLQ